MTKDKEKELFGKERCGHCDNLIDFQDIKDYISLKEFELINKAVIIRTNARRILDELEDE